MLLIRPDYAAKFTAFVSRLSASGSTEEAFRSVYGKTIPEVEADLNSYFRQGSLNGILFSVPFQKFASGAAREATELEIGLTLAKLLSHTGHIQEASDRLQQLGAAYPNRWEVEEALGYLAWREGATGDAFRHLRLAVARGATSWRTYWDFAQASASAGGEPAERIQALRKSLALQPEHAEARLMLGTELYRQNQYAPALAELRQVKTIDPDRAASLLLTMAYASLALKQDQAAKQYAELARKHARSSDETASADQIMRHIREKRAP